MGKVEKILVWCITYVIFLAAAFAVVVVFCAVGAEFYEAVAVTALGIAASNTADASIIRTMAKRRKH